MTRPSISRAARMSRRSREASLARAAAAIPAWFGRLPKAACEVVRMGPHEEEHSTIAYYRAPAADGSRPGRYYLNTSRPRPGRATRRRRSRSTRPFRATTCRSPSGRSSMGCRRSGDTWGRPRTSRAGACTPSAWPTRWACTRGDLDRIGVLSYDAWRAGRLVVDTGMHALGWSRDRAIAFMTGALGAGGQQHRQRGRPVHRVARPGARLQDRPAGAAAAARRGPGSVWAAGSTSEASTTWCWARARCRCRRSPASSTTGSRARSPAGAGDARRSRGAES